MYKRKPASAEKLAKIAEWQKANPERVRATKKKYRDTNKDKAKAYHERRKAEDPSYLAGRNKYRQANLPNMLEYERKYRAKHRQEMRAYNYLRKYGITLDDFARMRAEQEDKCAICVRPFKDESSINVDHNHITGQVRGLLCTACNMRLGVLENVDWHDAALAYLAKHNRMS